MKLFGLALVTALLLFTGCGHGRVPDSRQAIAALTSDPLTRYTIPVFFFCPMDASAVPVLMAHIADSNPRVRQNAVNLLGKWLMTPEAIGPFQARYFNEPDDLVRKGILDSLEMLIVSPEETKAFLRRVIRDEHNSKLNAYARVMLDNFDEKRARAANGPTTPPDPGRFKAAYDIVYQSAGAKGDLDQLLRLSGPDDEDALKALRIRILKRDTDEALFDYQKINGAILRHRYRASENPDLAGKPPQRNDL